MTQVARFRFATLFLASSLVIAYSNGAIAADSENRLKDIMQPSPSASDARKSKNVIQKMSTGGDNSLFGSVDCKTMIDELTNGTDMNKPMTLRGFMTFQLFQNGCSVGDWRSLAKNLGVAARNR